MFAIGEGRRRSQHLHGVEHGRYPAGLRANAERAQCSDLDKLPNRNGQFRRWIPFQDLLQGSRGGQVGGVGQVRHDLDDLADRDGRVQDVVVGRSREADFRRETVKERERIDPRVDQ